MIACLEEKLIKPVPRWSNPKGPKRFRLVRGDMQPLRIGADDAQIQRNAVENRMLLSFDRQPGEHFFVATQERVRRSLSLGNKHRRAVGKPSKEIAVVPIAIIKAKDMLDAIEQFEENMSSRLWLPNHDDREAEQIGLSRTEGPSGHRPVWITRISKDGYFNGN